MLSRQYRNAIPLIAMVLLVPRVAWSTEWYADATVEAAYTSNVYLDYRKEADAITAPSLLLGADFSNPMSVEYSGRADFYWFHSDLFFQRHGLHFFVEPKWGETEENSFISELSVMTQRNADTYESIDFVEPRLDLSVNLEPTHWLRWSLCSLFSYRLFYNDVASDSLDTWAGGSVTFTIPSRTTIGPRFRYGFRYYPRPDGSVTDDTNDQQIEAGLHLSQGLSRRDGLQADYLYTHTFGVAGLVERKLTQTEFGLIGEDFLYSGHRSALGYKHLFDMGLRVGLDVTYEIRDYPGWEISGQGEGDGGGPGNDSESVGSGDGGGTGNESGSGNRDSEDRSDRRLAPGAWVAFAFGADRSASRFVPDISLKLQYEYWHQWSNDPWHDTHRHWVVLSVEAAW